MLHAALHYARNGLPVFPCNPHNKRPLVAGGFHAATTSSTQLTSWWQRFPKAFIAMPTGSASGIDVIDIDYDASKGKDGFKSLPQWQSLTPLRVRTPRGGMHLYFQSKGQVRCTTGVIGEGVDTRGSGGYVILPPSLGYAFEQTQKLGLNELPEFPVGLLPLVTVSEHAASNGDVLADIELLRCAFAVIPNDNLGWHEWNTRGMALFAASEGSEEGFTIFDAWSKQNRKYNTRITAERWRMFAKSRPGRIGAGSICYWANAVSPGQQWRKKYDLKRWQEAEDAADALEAAAKEALRRR